MVMNELWVVAARIGICEHAPRRSAAFDARDQPRHRRHLCFDASGARPA
jgi:hypothetical protein